MALLKNCPYCKQQRPSISFANNICGDCIQRLIIQKLNYDDDLVNSSFGVSKLREIMEHMESIAPACKTCGAKHVSLTFDKCSDCRKIEAKVYDCLFCEDQELLLDNKDNKQWIYGMNCVCSSCKNQLFISQYSNISSYWKMYNTSSYLLEEFKAQIHGEIKSKYWDKNGTYRFEKVRDSLSSMYYRGQSMLYLHYEEFQILNPQTNTIQDLVKFIFSTSFSQKKMFGAVNFATLKDCTIYIKQIPASERTYDPQSNVWVVPKDKFEGLKKIFLAMQYISNESYIKKHELLQDFIDGVSRSKPKEIPKAEDFFYTYGQPQSQPTLPKEAIALKLEAFFKLADPSFIIINADGIALQKMYRKVAMILHPDRNNGDGSRMADLNMYWQLYKQ